MEALTDALRRLDVAVVGWASDGKLASIESRATRHPVAMPLSDLGSALAIVLTYVFVIAVLRQIMISTHGPEPATRVKGLSVREKFTREPVLMLQALYNPTQVALCCYMVYTAMSAWRSRSMKLYCNEFDTAKTDMAHAVWIFYLSKILDFFDTFFMVVRRHWGQLSFLHLYHHTSIFMTYWLVLNAGYDGDIYFTVALNSAVHAFMYTYYGCSTLNIALPGFVKPLITKIQMLQFCAMLASAMATLYYDECVYPKGLMMYYLFYIISMLVLFTDFSKKTYGGKKGQAEQGQAKKQQ